MIKRGIKYLLATLLGLGIIYLFIAEVRGNFYAIDNDAYRSGVLRSYNLPYYLEKHQIKTILNLQGASDKAWYRDEITIAHAHGVTHIDHKLSNRKYYDYNHTAYLVHLLKEAEKPLLIHCRGGADRTSMVAALYEYAIKGKSAQEAKKQLAWYYGHLPLFRTKVRAMDRSFDNYVKESKQLKSTSKESNNTP